MDSSTSPLRNDAVFRRFWLARVCSLAGTAVTYVAMPALVYQLTGSNLWTAFVAVAVAAPFLCFGLVAGVVADRVDRRRLMVATDVANAALLASVPIAYAAGVLTAVQVLLVALASQSLWVFFEAAGAGGLPALVGRGRIAAAQSAIYGAEYAVEAIMPMLAGLALVVVRAPTLLAVDAISFAASALLIRSIVRPFAEPGAAPVAGRHPLAGVWEGLLFVWRHPHVRVLTGVGFVQCLAGGAYMGQVVPWADQTLGVGPDDGRIGLLFAAWGVGGLIASLLYPRIVGWLGEARAALAFLPLSALGSILMAASGHWLAAALSVAGWVVAYMTVAMTQVTLRQKVSPDRLQGRVHTAARMLSLGLGWPVGAVLGGVIADAADPHTSMTVVAGILVAGAVAVWFSPLRRPVSQSDSLLVASSADAVASTRIVSDGQTGDGSK